MSPRGKDTAGTVLRGACCPGYSGPSSRPVPTPSPSQYQSPPVSWVPLCSTSLLSDSSSAGLKTGRKQVSAAEAETTVPMPPWPLGHLGPCAPAPPCITGRGGLDLVSVLIRTLAQLHEGDSDVTQVRGKAASLRAGVGCGALLWAIGVTAPQSNGASSSWCVSLCHPTACPCLPRMAEGASPP